MAGRKASKAEPRTPEAEKKREKALQASRDAEAEIQRIKAEKNKEK
jgi:hypothetical protein